MASTEEKVNCVLWLAEMKSILDVQKKFRSEYNKQPPHRNTIAKWMTKFKETGSVHDKHRSGRPRISDDSVSSVVEAFTNSPKKSVRRASLELKLPKSTVHKILRIKLHMKAYKIQIHQTLLQDDYYARLSFCHQFNGKRSSDDAFLSRLIFSDEATFHISGKVNRHNCRIWGTENPHEDMEHERDSPKVNVWCTLGRDQIIGPYFFEDRIINGGIYLDMLQNYFIPQLEQFDLKDNIVFQLDGAPFHFALCVRQFLNHEFPNRWIGRGGPFPWP